MGSKSLYRTQEEETSKDLRLKKQPTTSEEFKALVDYIAVQREKKTIRQKSLNLKWKTPDKPYLELKGPRCLAIILEG